MRLITSLEKCTGCAACFNICTHQAIEMIEDVHGFVHPVINDQCVDCGLCEKICPVNHPVVFNKPILAFAGIAKKREELWESSSGGIATVLSRTIIANGGVVYGCTGIDCHHVRHARIDQDCDLWMLKGSKYVQSEIAFVFRQIREDLKFRNVLFIGTPCQNAGLKAYLGKNYDNLFCVDFVCHGVPSQKILSDAINSSIKETVDKKSNSVCFRRRKMANFPKDGSVPETLFGLYISAHRGKYVYSQDFPKDLYITGFLFGLFYRKSCHSCQYAQIERVSDITVGDFCDATTRCVDKGLPENGLSTLMINTDKGHRLFQMINQDIDCVEFSVDEMRNRHGQMRHPFVAHHNRDLFLYKYEQYGFEKAVKRALARYYWSVRLTPLKKAIMTIPYMSHLYGIIKGKKSY